VNAKKLRIGSPNSPDQFLPRATQLARAWFRFILHFEF
jgi:hypothetical protein